MTESSVGRSSTSCQEVYQSDFGNNTEYQMFTSGGEGMHLVYLFLVMFIINVKLSDLIEKLNLSSQSSKYQAFELGFSGRKSTC